jgi:hypothetical protein
MAIIESRISTRSTLSLTKPACYRDVSILFLILNIFMHIQAYLPAVLVRQVQGIARKLDTTVLAVLGEVAVVVA